MSSHGFLPTVYVTDVLADSNHADIDSESGRARSLPRARRHSRSLRRMKRGGSSPAPAPPPKRRCAQTRAAANESENDLEDKDEEIEGAETEMQQIRYDEIHLWYDKVFRSLKQLCCKDILRAWIRHAHPNKQTKYPYNGGKDEADIRKSMRLFDYEGHYSKPDYWPNDRGWKKGKGVRHKEPDHLNRHGPSVRLLIANAEVDSIQNGPSSLFTSFEVNSKFSNIAILVWKL